jgi:hypothetical protein
VKKRVTFALCGTTDALVVAIPSRDNFIGMIPSVDEPFDVRESERLYLKDPGSIKWSQLVPGRASGNYEQVAPTTAFVHGPIQPRRDQTTGTDIGNLIKSIQQQNAPTFANLSLDPLSRQLRSDVHVAFVTPN